jgi:hypothetical protein
MPQASLLLLENVQAISISFLPSRQTPDDSAWLPYWPLPSAQVPTVGQGVGQGADQALNRFMPAAIRVLLQTPELGQVERIFLLAGV